MTQEITAEQAPQIHDLESYKLVTGAKRFKRTADEMSAGLSPEEALQKRLEKFAIQPIVYTQPNVVVRPSPGPNTAILVKPGDIVIRIRPGKGVSPDYFEHLPQSEIVVEEDNAFYSWLDVKLGGQYKDEIIKFFTELLDQGIGELIDHPTFERVESQD